MIDLVEPVTLTFALRYLVSFSKATPLSPNVTLMLNKARPDSPGHLTRLWHPSIQAADGLPCSLHAFYTALLPSPDLSPDSDANAYSTCPVRNCFDSKRSLTRAIAVSNLGCHAVC